MLIFADALFPITVLNPSPVYPPLIPLTCCVGRRVPDSRTVNPSSWKSFFTPSVFAISASFQGRCAIAARVSTLGGTTSS